MIRPGCRPRRVQLQSIDEISAKYLGRPYPNFSGRPETRMIMTIEADSVRGLGAR